LLLLLFFFIALSLKLGNHDNSRIATRVGPENVNIANALLLLLGGTPIVYYGEEIGMEDLPLANLKFNECQDQFGKKYGV
jgi:glycosidase